MKILYVLGPTSMSGAAISFRIIFDVMADKGCELVVLVARHNKNEVFIDYLKSRGCEVEEFDAEAYVYPACSFLSWKNSAIKYPLRLIRKFRHIIASNKEVLSLVQKHKPDIVHTNVGIYRQGLFASRKLNIPHLWHIREYQTKDFGWNIISGASGYKKLLISTSVICITKDILNYFGLKEGASACSMWDAVLPKSDACFKKKKKNFFLVANRISPEKKVEDAVLAFLAAAEKLPADYRLLIIGEQHNKFYLEELKKQIVNSAFADRIEFREHQPNVTALMEDATALIVSSQFEGLGRMTLESIFKGCLVLGRATGGTKEILETTEGGFLFNTVAELSEKMLHVVEMRSSEDYQRMINCAQLKVVEACSNEAYGEKIYNIYRSLAA